MAATTIGAELAVMHVVSAMTVAAVVVDGLDFRKRAPVTLGTGDVGVTAHQREIRLNVVVEIPRLPADRVMARVTALVEIAIVVVVLEMARDAGAVGIGERLVFMALAAFLVAMLAQ